MIDFDSLLVGTIIDVLGEDAPIFYRAAGVASLRVKGVFDARAKEVTGFSQMGLPISDQMPKLFLREADLVKAGIAASPGDKVTIGATDYQVSDVDPDSFGGIVLKLNQLVVPA
jgi:hypothetical protein